MDVHSKSEIFKNYDIIKAISTRSRVFLVRLKIHDLDHQAESFDLIELKRKFPETIILKEFDNSGGFKNELLIMQELKKLNKQLKETQLHFLKLYHFSSHLNKFKLFIQYCEKGSLANQILEKLKDEEDLMLQKFIHIIQSLTIMHNNKIVHRDLKPDNIFITKEGTPIIGDFGLSIMKTSKDPVGTPNYMSPVLKQRYALAMNSRKKYPESINWEREDLFSLGKTFYEYSVLRLYENFSRFDYEDIKIKVSRDLESLGYKNKYIRTIALMMSDENEENVILNDIGKIFIQIKDNYDSLVLDDDIKLKENEDDFKAKDNSRDEGILISEDLNGIKCIFTVGNFNEIKSLKCKSIKNLNPEEMKKSTEKIDKSIKSRDPDEIIKSTGKIGKSVKSRDPDVIIKSS